MLARLCLFSLLMLLLQPAAALEQITLQLKWTHAFQFAGYYAAKELGYYRDVGLDVNIQEGVPGLDPVKSVVDGKADFGVGTSSLVLHRHDGEPVVVLACIFQHSPYVLIARQQSATQSVHDMIDKRIMLEPQADELLAFLNKEGIPASRLIKMQHSFNPQDLIKGNVDVMSAYITNEIYYLDQANYSYQVYSPRSSGIDFYGDTLFTSQYQLDAHPGRVKAFREASLRGWEYAMSHPKEIAKLIFERYSQKHAVDYYLFEANQMTELIKPDIIEMGYVNPGRWQHIAQVYADIGMLPQSFNLDGFIYNPNPKHDLRAIYQVLAASILALSIIAIFAFYVHRINRRLADSLSELHKSELLMRGLFESTSDAVMMLEANVFIDCNPAAISIFGCHSKDELIGRRPDEVSPLNQPCGTPSKILAERHLNRAMKKHHDQFEWVHKRLDNGMPFNAEVHLNIMHLNEKVLLQAVVRDITSRKVSEEKIHNFAFYDALTGLPNRRLLWDRLGLMLAASKRNGKLCVILFLDLDNFKPLNDQHGHLMGDLLLIEVARRISSIVRETDTVARYGGDEFVVMLGDLSSNESEAQAQALQMAEKIRLSVAKPYLMELNHGTSKSTIEHRCTSSIGVLLINKLNQDKEKILEQADAAMYHAKENGRNQIYFKLSDAD